MRSLELIEVAAAAEALVLRRGAEDVARRSVLLGIAALFGLTMLGLLHAAGWMVLAEPFGPLAAALTLSIVDAMVMLMALLLARKRHDPVAAEALRLRGQAIAGIGQVAPLVEEVGTLLVKALLRRLGRA
jgi:hypothetical protein